MEKIEANKVDNTHRFLQFELWKDCKNNCLFCQNKGLDDVDKIKSMKFILDKLYSTEIDDYNEIGFIGGEFFDGQLSASTIKSMFYKLIARIFDLLKTGKLTKFYITATLIYDDLFDLTEFLDQVAEEKLEDKILICTSYDTVYRFLRKGSEEKWRNIVKYIHTKWPTINVHTETIVTQDFINKVLSGEFDIKKFAEENKTYVDYIEPHTGFYYKNREEFCKALPLFLPTRASFLKFLKFVYDNNLIDIRFLFNKNLKSNDFYIHYKKGELIQFKGRRTYKDRTCGLNLDHTPHWGYCDSDIDISDDVEMFLESVNG